MRKTLTLEIPTSWKDVTLKQYLALQADLESYRDDEEAQTALTLYHLCGLDAEYLSKLSADSYNKVRSKLNEFISPESIELQQFVTIGDTEYGFEPNLSKMSYGAYADITKHDTIAIDNNWQKIMAVLYRKVKSKSGKYYDIEPYTGNEDYEWVKNTTMDINYGCLFFFINLSKDLVLSTLKSLKKEEWETHQLLKSIMGKNGEGMLRLLNLQTETSQSSIR
jgi:hypothetical protein